VENATSIPLASASKPPAPLPKKYPKMNTADDRQSNGSADSSSSTWSTLSYSQKYARYRPQYPEDLFQQVLGQLPPERRRLLMDVGCGSGQALLPLAKHFRRSVGVDPSVPHLREAERLARATLFSEEASEQTNADGQLHPHQVKLEVGRAGHPSIFDALRRAAPDGEKPDVIVVAEALHWFDVEAFGAQVRSLLKPGGVLAVWAYHADTVAPAPCGAVFQRYLTLFHDRGHWPLKPDEDLETAYARFAAKLPFAVESTSKVAATTNRTIDEFAAYLSTLACVIRYMKHTGDTEVLDRLVADLRAALPQGAPDELECTLPITLFLYKNHAGAARL